MPRPKVRGPVVDFHCHLHALRHAPAWFAAADHYGIDFFCTMTPLEEAMGLQRHWGHRLHFIAVPRWGEWGASMLDSWLRRLEAFYNMGSRIAKFWFAPPAIGDRKFRLDSPLFLRLLAEVRDRGMAVMTHIGDPELWYAKRYSDPKYGTRDEHYQMWENAMAHCPRTPWIGAHLGGNPENLPRLQRLLDRWPKLMLDCSATKWLQREVSLRRDETREFIIRNRGRILFGSDQVSSNDRGFEFLASRFWVHRKLWETAFIGPSPIHDPDLPEDAQVTLRGLALPDDVLQALYHDNAQGLLAGLGMDLGLRQTI